MEVVSSDVVIVGAGVAGCSLAYALGKDGRRVHVIERNLKEPDRIVGEILQPAGYLKLLELGLGECVEDIDAQKIFAYTLHKIGKSNDPLEYCDIDVAARSFHHGRFVQKLRQKAASLPNVNVEQGNVTSLIEENEEIKGVRYKTQNGQDMTSYASLTVVCDGGFSNHRKSLANPKIDHTSNAVGMILENCEISQPNVIHFIIEDTVCGVVYPISSTEFRFLTYLPGPKVASVSHGEMAHYLKTVVGPWIPHEMYSAFMSSIDKGDIRVMPVRNMSSAPCLKAGAVIIGDALNMRNPITAIGMTVALHDVVLFRNLLKFLDFHDSNALTKCTREFYNARKPMAFTMNVLANSFYEIVFATSGESRKIVQQAIFDYLSLGRTFSRGFVVVLSGMNHHKSKLTLNVLCIGLYTIGRLLFVPSPKRLYAAARLTLEFASILVPIILKEM